VGEKVENKNRFSSKIVLVLSYILPEPSEIENKA